MSLIARGLDLSIPQQLTSLAAVHQQNRSEGLDLANYQGSLWIDDSVSENRLYERGDGSIGLSEKPIGYVIGEQVVRPLIDAISNVWKSCIANMIWGAAGSLATKDPAPLALSALSCLPRLEASGLRDQLLNDRQPTRVNTDVVPDKTPVYKSISNKSTASDSISIYAETHGIKLAKMRLYIELIDVIPRSIQKTLDKIFQEDDWFWALLTGTEDFVLSDVQVDIPINTLKRHLEVMELFYWMHVVRPEFLKIFPKTNVEWDDFGVNYGKVADLFEVRCMRRQLKQHNYIPEKNGTPLQFTEWLVKHKQCFGGWCKTIPHEDHPG